MNDALYAFGLLIKKLKSKLDQLYYALLALEVRQRQSSSRLRRCLLFLWYFNDRFLRVSAFYCNRRQQFTIWFKFCSATHHLLHFCLTMNLYFSLGFGNLRRD